MIQIIYRGYAAWNDDRKTDDKTVFGEQGEETIVIRLTFLSQYDVQPDETHRRFRLRQYCQFVILKENSTQTSGIKILY
jgi:hypothetical protein